MQIIARIHTDFPTKFGVPRQSGLVEELESYIVFEPPFRNPDAVRGIDGWSHLWLIWQFDRAVRDGWSATVLPPRLGGKTRVGVFATRSPFRPNPIGLSSVKLLRVQMDEKLGPVLHVAGADLVDNTPIYDIKPYLPYADCHTDATGGFTEQIDDTPLEVKDPENLLRLIPEEKRQALIRVLSLNPKPGYQHDPTRRYGFNFCGRDVRFTIDENVLTVVEIVML
ncbi:MAG: tRNA (N6-threonylcarbamoyladenosine(37)-N6)-methyltransferase TrmO [Oscillospiraceae bacterium]|nr:tRNA (N6-threonylcarbamoyladenosine(37)-N6)-methyltransferase TrmO [Oscillospiraceae bacterium]